MANLGGSSPAGWYPDPYPKSEPDAAPRWRYWDGTAWSSRLSSCDPNLGAGTPAGWYSDPRGVENEDQQRYWNGSAWTEQVRDPYELTRSLSAAPVPWVRWMLLLLILALALISAFLIGRSQRSTESAATDTTRPPDAASTTASGASDTTRPPETETTVDPGPTDTTPPGSPVLGSGTCVETSYEGRVNSVQVGGGERSYVEVESQITAGLGADCAFGAHLFWVIETNESGSDVPLCYALLGGGGGTVDERGSIDGSHTLNAGSFTPTPGGAAQTCRALVDEGNVGQYLGQRGNAFTGQVSAGEAQMSRFSTDPDQGNPWIVLDITFTPTG